MGNSDANSPYNHSKHSYNGHCSCTKATSVYRGGPIPTHRVSRGGRKAHDAVRGTFQIIGGVLRVVDAATR